MSFSDDKTITLTEGMFDEFLDSVGVSVDRGCPRCGSTELWNISGKDKTKSLGTYKKSQLDGSHGGMRRLQVGIECMRCGYLEDNY